MGYKRNNVRIKKPINIYNGLGWLVFAVTAVFVFFYLIPRKGVDFTDEGYLLYEAMSFASGYPFDPIAAQAPAFVINGFLMDMGVTNYLHLRYAYYLLIILSMYVLLSGFDIAKKNNYLIPIGISFGLLTTFVSLISYQNAPLLFLLISLGFVFRAIDNNVQTNSKIMAIFSGIFLALSCIVNVTLLPAACLCCLLLFIASTEKKIILISTSVFLICTVLFFSWYLSKIGLEAFLQPPGGHGFDFNRIKLFFAFSIQWPLFFAVIFIPLKVLSLIMKKKQAVIISIIKIFQLICMPLLCFIFLMIISQQALKTEYVFFPKKLFTLLQNYFYWIGVLQYEILFNIIAIFGWAILSLSLLAMNSISKSNKRILSCILSCYIYWFFQMFFSLMQMPLTPIFYTGVMISLGFVLWHNTYFNDNYNKSKPFIISMSVSAVFALSVCLIFSLYWNQSGWTSIFAKKEKLDLPMVSGIMETPERKRTLTKLNAAYQANKCSERVLITLENTPLLHYFFQQPAPLGLSYIRPAYIYPEEKILNILKSRQKWCVFYSRNYGEGGEATEKKTKPLLDFIKKNSLNIIKIQTGESIHSYDDFVLFMN